MKKLIALILFLAVVAFIIYKIVLPRIILYSTVQEGSGDYGSALPTEVKEQIVRIPASFDSLGIKEEEAIAMVNSIKQKDVLSSLDSLNRTQFTSADQVAELLINQFNLSAEEENTLRSIIVNDFTVYEIKTMQRLLNENRELIPVLLPVIKETFKQLIRNPELAESYKKQMLRNIPKDSGANKRSGEDRGKD